MRLMIVVAGLLVSVTATAEPCKDLYEQFALRTQDGWNEEHKMFLVYCPDDASWKLVLRETKTAKELDRISLRKPGGGARWFFDAGSFAEKGTEVRRNKAILDRSFGGTDEAWAMSLKKHKLEKLSLGKLIPPEPVP